MVREDFLDMNTPSDFGNMLKPYYGAKIKKEVKKPSSPWLKMKGC